MRIFEYPVLIALLLVVFARPALSGTEREMTIPEMVSGASKQAWPASTVPVGVGFFVAEHGLIISAAHIVSGCRQIEALTPSGALQPATLLGLDNRFDMALLKLPVANASVATFVKDAKAIPSGRVITLVGFGQANHEASDPVVAKLTTAGTISTLAIAPLLRLSGTTSPGMSGSPLVDTRGKVIGLLIGRLEADSDHAVAIRANEIAKFLSYHGIQEQSAHEKTGRVSSLSQIATLVQCKR